MVQRMTALERGIYRELLDEQWRVGSLQNDPKWLAAAALCTEDELATAWRTLSECFPAVEGSDGTMLQNPRLESERSEMDAKRVKATISGALGGRAKANANRPLSERHIAVAEQSNSSSTSGAASALALMASARAECPWGCGGKDGEHTPDCKPSRLTAPTTDE